MIPNPCAKCKVVLEYDGPPTRRALKSQRIEFCPLHAAAEEMLVAARKVVTTFGPGGDRYYEKRSIELLAEQVAKAEGK